VDGSVRQEASRDGLVGFEGDATRELNASAFEGLPHDSVAPTVGGAELMGELKKMNKNLRRMIQSQKQSNLIAFGFLVGILALVFYYLMVISR
jgi:hypothetical protein